MVAEWVFWIALALSPFYNVWMITTSIVEIPLIDIIFFCAFICWLAKELLTSDGLSFKRVYRYLILFMIIALVSCLFSGEFISLIKRWARTFLYVAIFAVMMPSLMSHSRRWQVYVFLFIISGTLFGAINYWEFFISPTNFISSFFEGNRIVAQLPLIYKQDISEGLGVFENYGHEIGHWSSAILPIVIALLVGGVKKSARIFLIVCLIVSMTTLLLSMTKTAWGGLLVAIIYMFLRLTSLTYDKKVEIGTATRETQVILKRKAQAKKIFFGSIIAFVVIGIIAFMIIPENIKSQLVMEFLLEGQSALSRLDIWHETLSIFSENPWFGIGLGGFMAKDLPDPHNWWLGILSQTGFLGFLSWCLFFSSLIYSLDRKLKTLPEAERYVAWGANAALVGLAFRGCFEMSFMWSINVWFCIGLGLFFIVKSRQEQSFVQRSANA